MYKLMQDIILCIIVCITVMQSSEMCLLDVMHAIMGVLEPLIIPSIWTLLQQS